MKKMLFPFVILGLLLCWLAFPAYGDVPSSLIRQAQEKLKEVGFNPGPSDGLFGSRTKTALRQFQRERALPMTGLLDEATRRALGIEGDRKKPAPKKAEDFRVKQGRDIQKPHEQGTTDSTGPSKKPNLYLVFSKADLTRLAILVALGLGAWSIGGWLLYSTLGSILTVVLHYVVGWPLASSAMAGLSAAYVIPLSFRILRENPRITLAYTLFFGTPAFLISKFILDTSWLFAVAESVALMHLTPTAILRTLIRSDIIRLPERSSEASSKEAEPFRRPESYSRLAEKTFSSGAPSSGSASSPIQSPSNRPW